MQVQLNYSRIINDKVWQISLLARSDRFNDQRFFGFGANPQTDSRNKFNTDALDFEGISRKE